MKVFVVIIKNSDGNCNEYNDCFLDEKEALKCALSLSNEGYKVDVFSKTFNDNTINELICDKIDNDKIIKRIGDLYDDGTHKGIICAVDENNQPKLIMSMDGPQEKMSWDSMIEYSKTLKEGWHIPSKNELEQIWKKNSETTNLLKSNEITNILNNGFAKFNGVPMDKDYSCWSYTENTTRAAYVIDTYLGWVILTCKHGFKFNARPVFTVKS